MSATNDYSSLLPVLARMQLLDPVDSPSVNALSGGVSSLIVRVDTRHGPVCVKQALPQLRVASHWSAPLSRNFAEVAWMREVGRHFPRAVPRVLVEDPASHAFAMQWLAPDRHPVWKAQLRDGIADPAFAATVAALIGAIHASTATRPALADAFSNDANFFALRLDPYFLHAAAAHPDCAPVLQQLVADTAAYRLALVHGDISPKNILAGPDGPVLLDAECAVWGDPAFDAAFCLCHLLAKCLWQPEHRDAYLACFDAFAAAYLAACDWEPVAGLEQRAALLLAAILLARVDGKSPLEYLDEPARERQRAFARRRLRSPVQTLAATGALWRKEVCG